MSRNKISAPQKNENFKSWGKKAKSKSSEYMLC